MKRLLLILITLVNICFAQQYQKPKYDELEKLITSEGENNYKNLLAKLTSNDTTLNNDQYYVLYHAQILQQNYSPFSINKKLDSLLNNNEIDEYIVEAKRHLTTTPFDLRTRNTLVYLLHKNKDDAFKTYNHALNGFIDAIFKTGNGNSKETALHVYSTTDEYIILQLLGLSMSRRWTDKPYDVFELKDNKYKLTNMYFDLTKYFERLSQIFKN